MTFHKHYSWIMLFIGVGDILVGKNLTRSSRNLSTGGDFGLLSLSRLHANETSLWSQKKSD